MISTDHLIFNSLSREMGRWAEVVSGSSLEGEERFPSVGCGWERKLLQSHSSSPASLSLSLSHLILVSSSSFIMATISSSSSVISDIHKYKQTKQTSQIKLILPYAYKNHYIKIGFHSLSR